jgi:hypothetical protein
MNRSSFGTRVHALQLLLAAVVVLLSARTVRAQETWAPVIMFDGLNITINNAQPVSQGAVPPYSGTQTPQLLPDPLISFPNGIVENPVANEWIVSDTYHSRLLRFANDNNQGHATGAFLGELDLPDGSWPYSPVVDEDGTILVPDKILTSKTIYAFVPNASGYSGAIAISNFQYGSTPDQFSQPTRIALVPDPAAGMHIAQSIGTVVVLDSGHDRVVKLQPTGGAQDGSWTATVEFGQSAAEFGSGPGKFAFPTGLAVDAAGNIYVTDPQNESLVSVQVFDPNGNSLQLISQGLSAPWSITIDPAGRLFVTDTANNRIAVFAKYDAQNPTQSLAPLDVHIGSANQPLGGVVAFGVPNPAGPIGTLQEPTALAFDQFGRLLVADTDDFRIQIFDKAGLNVTVLAYAPYAMPPPAYSSTIGANATTVTVRVAVSLPDGGTDNVSNVLPAIPNATFQQGGTAVVTVPPACVVMPNTSPCVDPSLLTGLPLAAGDQLVYAFEFNRVLLPAEVDGPVWFSTSATGTGTSGPVESGVVQTYAIAVGGDHFNSPTITSSLSPAPPASGWYNTAPVTVNLQASLVNSGSDAGESGFVQEIDFNFGPTAPDEGDFYTCFNYFTAFDQTLTSCALPVYKEGVTRVWYRALSTTGLYDHLTASTLDSTVQVPGWSSVDVQLDYSAPTFSLTAVNPSNPTQTIPSTNGWYNTLPLTLDYTATDLGSLLNTVTVDGGGGVVNGTSTSGQPFANGTITFSQEGLYNVSLTATDLAGNVGVGPYTIGIDATAPTVTFASATSQTIAGQQWSATPITATFNATDALSGFDANGTKSATCTAAVPLGLSQSVTCSIADYAGNVGSGTMGGFNTDNAAPTVTATPAVQTAFVQGVPWYNGPVTVTFSANDNGGVGFAGGQTQQSTQTSNGPAVSATFADLLNNSGSASAGPFNIDTTAPAVSYAVYATDSTPVGPGTRPGPGVLVRGATFYAVPVVVDFTGSDTGSGFDTDHPVPTLVRSHPVNTGPISFTETYTDVVGNSTTLTAGPFSVDGAAPTYSFTTLPPGVLQGSTRWYAASPATVTFVGDDGPAGSGFASGETQTTTVNVVNNMATTSFTDLVGNGTNAVAGPFSIDVTPPTYTFTTSPAGQLVGSTRWYTSTPTSVTFNATDLQSGFAGGATTSTTVPVTSNTASTTFKDLVGNSVTATAGPFAVDGTAPTITVSTPAPNATVGTTPWYKGPSITVTFTGNDNGGVGFSDGTEMQTSTQSSIGGAVRATFTDALGNSAMLSAGPFNVDDVGPVVTTATTYLDGTAAAGVTIGGVTYFKAPVKIVFTATDAGVGFSTVSPVATSTQTVTVSGAAQLISQTFTDILGNATTASLGTYAVDMTAPIITVPTGGVTVPASTPASNPTSAVVTFSVSATDNVGTTTTTCSPASGATFAFGATTVTCTATDAVGNTATSSFTVTVQDKTPPVLQLPANMVLNVGVPQNVTFSVTATDNLDPHPTVSCSPASGSLFQVTTTTVTCTATDASSNTATGSFTVQLSGPSTPPTVTVPVNQTLEATGPGGTVYSYTASASDSSGSVAVSCTPASARRSRSARRRSAARRPTPRARRPRHSR